MISETFIDFNSLDTTIWIAGIASMGGICTVDESGGLASDYSPIIGIVAATVAHEIGHNLGMDHDNETLCECDGEQCMMHPKDSNETVYNWSSCSKQDLNFSLNSLQASCLL